MASLSTVTTIRGEVPAHSKTSMTDGCGPVSARARAQLDVEGL